MTYAPPIAKAEELRVEQQATADGPELQTCWIQKEPARQLPRLRSIPIAVVATEASYHAPFDHCTVRWLVQAGAKIDFLRLAEFGIHGNGHMVMLEKNNLDVAAVLSSWIVVHAQK